MFDQTKHSRVYFLDLNIKAVYTTTMVEFEFGIHRIGDRKPGTPTHISSTAHIVQDTSFVDGSKQNAQAAHTLKQHKHLAKLA